MLLNEGLDAAYQRHLTNEGALVAGLEAMGLSIYGESNQNADSYPIFIPEG